MTSPARCRALLRSAGIGWYLHHLLLELAHRDDLRLRLYAHRLVESGAGLQTVVPLPAGPAIEWARYRFTEDTNLPAGLLAKLVARASPWLMAFDPNDVLFAPNYVPPPLFRHSRAPLVATIHDLTLWRFPEAMRPDTRIALERQLKTVLREARLLLTDSHAVREGIEQLGVASSRIRTVRLGPGLAPSQPSTQASGLRGPYGLFVGTIEPRKNLPLLLAAWRRMVICGRMGWADDETRQSLREATVQGWAQPLENVESSRLHALYRDATVVAIPSLYEGFGLPAAEALTAGTPLVCSDIPALREIAEDCAVYVEPLDFEAWDSALSSLLADDARRAELPRRGPLQVAKLSWAKTADDTAAAWGAVRRR
ncbi:MAG: glycosyltransferase family 1 protein [Acidobacteriota bacterium]